METLAFEEEKELLKCFRCDLGFWDACYTTETNCSLGERCYTGRGKAGVLDKTVILSVCVFTEQYVSFRKSVKDVRRIHKMFSIQFTLL